MAACPCSLSLGKFSLSVSCLDSRKHQRKIFKSVFCSWLLAIPVLGENCRTVHFVSSHTSQWQQIKTGLGNWPLRYYHTMFFSSFKSHFWYREDKHSTVLKTWISDYFLSTRARNGDLLLDLCSVWFI